MPEFSWRRGFRVRVSPETAWHELERIRKASGGGLQPRVIVDAARDPAAPLHPAFQWDDAKAAEAHRRSHARSLVRALVVVHDVAPEMPAQPAYVRVRVADQPRQAPSSRYIPLDIALRSPVTREELIMRAMHELIGWQARYREFREFADICAAVDAARAEFDPAMVT